jgi:hypothetical protein
MHPVAPPTSCLYFSCRHAPSFLFRTHGSAKAAAFKDSSFGDSGGTFLAPGKKRRESFRQGSRFDQPPPESPSRFECAERWWVGGSRQILNFQGPRESGTSACKNTRERVLNAAGVTRKNEPESATSREFT